MATNKHIEGCSRYRLKLPDARIGKDGTLWLNSGGKSSVSCVVTSEIVDALYERYNIGEEEDFAGAFLLILGTKGTGTYGKRKPYIRAESANHLTVLIIKT